MWKGYKVGLAKINRNLLSHRSFRTNVWNFLMVSVRKKVFYPLRGLLNQFKDNIFLKENIFYFGFCCLFSSYFSDLLENQDSLHTKLGCPPLFGGLFL